MLYSELAEQFDALEHTSSRLEMTAMLSHFFTTVPPENLRIIVYLCQGKLHPDFYGVELGMSDKLVLKAISSTSGTPLKETEKMWTLMGDPGAVRGTAYRKEEADDAVLRTSHPERVVKKPPCHRRAPTEGTAKTKKTQTAGTAAS